MRHLFGRTPKAIRAAVARKQLPQPLRLAGRLAWRAQDVLGFVADLHAARTSSSQPVHISAERYHYDPTRYRVDMLADLAAQDDPARFRRRLRKYTSPALLVVDEVGYMSYAQGYADLLFQVVNQRYLRRSTIVTTNRIFGDWAEVFPNAVSIVALADRLCHKAEILTIDADSYRTKETHERNTARRSRRKS